MYYGRTIIKTKGSKIKRLHLNRWLGVLISLALFVWILRGFDLGEVSKALRAASYFYLLPVIALILVSFILRTLRWQVLFREPAVPPSSSLFIAMMMGYLANNILPARAGEFVRAYELGRREGVARSLAFGTVVVERVADLVTAMLLLTFVLLAYPLPPWLKHSGVIVGAVTLVALTALIMLNVIGSQLVQLIARVLKFLPPHLLMRIENIAAAFVAGVSGLRHTWSALQFASYTALIWIVELLMTLMVGQMFHLGIPIPGMLFVMLVIGLGTMVPSSPGYLGTYEFFAINALGILGVPGSLALSFALVSHAITFLGASLIGAACFALRGFEFKAVLRHRMELPEVGAGSEDPAGE